MIVDFGPSTRVMGILNVTPDSFSDGGLHLETDKAIRHGVEMHEAGADFVDVGGESTRPGARRVSEEEELRRVLPVVSALASGKIPVSIDTTRATVAKAALVAGASVVNDVSGGLADPLMAKVIADAEVAFVAMHWRGASVSMARRAVYHDVVADVMRELSMRLEALVAAGIPERCIIVDPGLGFAKDAAHNWQLLAGLDRLKNLGRPILIGASRKSFLGQLAIRQGHPMSPDNRDALTCAVSALAAAAGIWGIRAHDVCATRQAVAVADAVAEAATGETR